LNIVVVQIGVFFGGGYICTDFHNEVPLHFMFSVFQFSSMQSAAKYMLWFFLFVSYFALWHVVQ